MYLVAAIDEKTSSGSTDEIWLALVATALNSKGTIGTPFLVSKAPYTSLPSHPSYVYNAGLAPFIYQQANLFGVWGGSAPGQTTSAWTGYITSGGATFVEPSTVATASSHSTLLRLWRAVSGTDGAWLYSSQSSDDGKTWSAPTRTNIPNAPSATGMIRLTDGTIALVGNPHNGSVPRDPLYLALFESTTGVVQSVYAVRQGLSGVPTYKNGQSGGAQYPAIWQNGNTLWISYSIAKQQIGVTSIPLSGLVTSQGGKPARGKPVNGTAAYVHVFTPSNTESVFVTSKVPGATITNRECFSAKPNAWNYFGYVTDAGDKVTLTAYQGPFSKPTACTGNKIGNTIQSALPNPLIKTSDCWFNILSNKLSGCNGR